MQQTLKEGTPIHFYDIKPGDTIRAVQTKDCGTTIITEGKAHFFCGNILHFGEIKKGGSSAAVINDTGYLQALRPIFYLLNRPLEESPITLLRNLPMNSPIEIHVERLYKQDNYTLKGKLFERKEVITGDFIYGVLGEYSSISGTLTYPTLVGVPEKRIKKLFILPQEPSSPTSKTSCTS